jgi:competence ComEA-like helix-hairpin-helix protein
MSAATPPLGVTTATAPPQPPASVPAPPPLRAVPLVWPRSAQIALVVLLALATSLLVGHVLSMQRWGSRPTDLDTSGTLFTKLDLNRADHVQLMQLPGVGDSLARNIEAYRMEHHGFRNVDELRQVRGIKATMLERLRPFVYVEEVEAEEENPGGAQPSHDSPPAPAARKTGPANVEKKTSSKKADALKDRINVNEASAAELQQLPHVGPTLASHIIEAREKKPFHKVDDLLRVPGIKDKTLETLRPYVTVDSSAKVETNQ